MKHTFRQSLTAASAVTLMGLLAACGGLEPSTDPAPPASDPSAAEEAETEEATAKTKKPIGDDESGSGSQSDEPNARGNVTKQVGEAAGISDESVGEDIAALTLTEIADPAECTGSFPEQPSNGRFVGLHFDVEVYDTWDEERWGEFYMTSFDFKAYKTDGTVINDPSGNAIFCMDEASSLPSTIGTATSASGWIALDLPQDAVSVAFEPSMLFGSGWEWELEQTS